MHPYRFGGAGRRSACGTFEDFAPLLFQSISPARGQARVGAEKRCRAPLLEGAGTKRMYSGAARVRLDEFYRHISVCGAPVAIDRLCIVAGLRTSVMSAYSLELPVSEVWVAPGWRNASLRCEAARWFASWVFSARIGGLE